MGDDHPGRVWYDCDVQVYLVTNVLNGKRYVGLTAGSLVNRWDLHLSQSRRSRSRQPLHAAIRKYGVDSFRVETIEMCSSEDQLRERERHWIRELGTFIAEGKGYNATLGGDGLLGYRHTDDAKRRMGEARRGQKNPNYGKRFGTAVHGFSEDGMARLRDRKGEKNPNYGRRYKLSVDTITKNFKQVRQLDLEENREIATYSSMLEAEKATGVLRQGISMCCRGIRRQAGGFNWEYVREADAYRGMRKAKGIQ